MVVTKTLPYRPHDPQNCEEYYCREFAHFGNGKTIVVIVEHLEHNAKPWYYELRQHDVDKGPDEDTVIAAMDRVSIEAIFALFIRKLVDI